MEKLSPFGKWESAWERQRPPGGGFGGWKGALWGLLVLEGFILDKYLPVLASSPVLRELLGGFFWFWFIKFFKEIGSGSVSNLIVYLFEIWDWDLVLVFFWFRGGFGFSSFFNFQVRPILRDSGSNIQNIKMDNAKN